MADKTAGDSASTPGIKMAALRWFGYEIPTRCPGAPRCPEEPCGRAHFIWSEYCDRKECGLTELSQVWGGDGAHRRHA